MDRTNSTHPNNDRRSGLSFGRNIAVFLCVMAFLGLAFSSSAWSYPGVAYRLNYPGTPPSGAKWQLYSTNCNVSPSFWTNFGDVAVVYTNSNCNYAVRYSTVSGYCPPADIYIGTMKSKNNPPVNNPDSSTGPAYTISGVNFTCNLATYPSGTAPSGALWWVEKQIWSGTTTVGTASSGGTITDTSLQCSGSASYVIKFKAISGYDTPDDIPLATYGVGLNSLGTFYYKVNSVKFTATLAPTGAVNNGAQFRITRIAGTYGAAATTSWTASGGTATFADSTGATGPCEYVIEFQDVFGYIKPLSVSGTYSPSATTYPLGTFTYTEPTGPFCDDFNSASFNSNWMWTDTTANSTKPAYFSKVGSTAASVSATGASILDPGNYGSLYQNNVSGNWDAVVKITDNNDTAAWGKAGIVARNDMTTKSAGYIWVGVVDGYGLGLYADADGNGSLETTLTTGTSVSYPIWIKLSKSGSTYTGYFSSDGTNYTQISTSSYTLSGVGSTQDIGLLVSSYSSTTYKTVAFDDFCVSGAAAATVNFTCHILPTAVQGTARWRLYNIDAASYQTSWTATDVILSIPAGAHYNIEWSLVDGWTSPTNVSNVEIPAGLGCSGSCVVNGTYVYIPVTTTTTTTTTTTSSTSTLPTTTSSTTGEASLCIDIADRPLEAQMNAAPANIMFVLDDSGSMDWEFMTPEDQGKFSDESYLFNMSDNKSYGGVLSDTGMWKSQWSGYNRLYFDPSTDYDPWPTYSNASTTAPTSYPNSTTSGSINPMSTYQSVVANWTVDNTDSGFTYSSGIKSGSATSAYPTTSYPGSSYMYSNATGAQWARWTPPGLPAGTYNIYAWWPSGTTNRTTAAIYTISCSTGTYTSQSYNQNNNGGTWVQIKTSSGGGDFVFDGTGGYVQLSHTVSSLTSDVVSYDAIRFVPSGAPTVAIRNAHYYTLSSDSTPYLVNLDGSAIKYYKFGVKDPTKVEEAGIVEDTSPPYEVIARDSSGNAVTYAELLQNWCNWFSFYRRRILTAKGAVSRTIVDLQGVNVGLYSIWGRLLKPCQPVKVKISGVLNDNTSTLLSALYSVGSSGYYASGTTPLRTALNTVGQYFTQHTGTSPIGAWPYSDADAGGACQQSFTVLMSDGFWNDTFSAVGNVDDDSTDFSGVAPYTDTWSDTLADVAMKYYAYDLSSSLANQVPTNFQDKATHQHMVIYTVAFGQNGTLDPTQYDLTNTDATLRTYPTWPQPTKDSTACIDDMWHAAVNGRGSFLSAASTSELVDSLLAITQNIVSRIGSGASVAINGEELYSGTILFQSSYSADTWTGDVKSYYVDADSGAVLVETPIWSASTELQSTNWDTGRKLITYNGFSGIPFRYDSLTSLQKTQLNASDATRQAQLVKYLRGYQGDEVTNTGGIFRARTKVLGDIVHSAPLFVNDMLMAGGNDGIVHCFDADTGHEVFGYVPNAVFNNLSLLSLTNYVHMYYIDMPFTTSTVDNRTLVAGALGKGGKAVFLLDVTDAKGMATESAASSLIKWEYPNATTPTAEISGLGYTFSKSYIVKTHAGWGVMFGNGYASTDQKAKLYILNIADGSLMKVIDTQAGTCNGLSSPVPVDYDGDGTVDYAFAGDLKGNMWKFNLTSSSPSDWKVSYGSGTPKPLFTTCGTDGAPQPITSRPDAMLHCVDGLHGMIVCFGTGKYIGDTDYTDDRTQTIYGVWDYGDDEDASEYLGTLVRGSTGNTLSNQPNTVSLLEQEVGATVTSGGRTALVLTARDPVWLTENDTTTGQYPNPSSVSANNVGWYFDLPASRERVVRDPSIRDNKFTVISATPNNSACTGGGTSTLYELDPCTGGRTQNPKKPTFDVNNDGLVDENDFVVITDPDTGQTVTADVTGLVYNGLLFPPSVLRDGDLERLYMGTAGGTIESQAESSKRFGFFYWLEVQ